MDEKEEEEILSRIERKDPPGTKYITTVSNVPCECGATKIKRRFISTDTEPQGYARTRVLKWQCAECGRTRIARKED